VPDSGAFGGRQPGFNADLRRQVRRANLLRVRRSNLTTIGSLLQVSYSRPLRRPWPAFRIESGPSCSREASHRERARRACRPQQARPLEHEAAAPSAKPRETAGRRAAAWLSAYERARSARRARVAVRRPRRPRRVDRARRPVGATAGDSALLGERSVPIADGVRRARIARAGRRVAHSTLRIRGTTTPYPQNRCITHTEKLVGACAG